MQLLPGQWGYKFTWIPMYITVCVFYIRFVFLCGRFYGRIKALPEDHDKKTLECIQKNANGLAGKKIENFDTS